MKTKEPFVQKLVHKAAQGIVRRERYGWPPDSPWSAYQPHRPEKPYLSRRTKVSKYVISNNTIAPAAFCMRRAFLFQNFFVFNVKVYLTFGIYNFVRAKMRW
mgnify:CR=1 FL=1